MSPVMGAEAQYIYIYWKPRWTFTLAVGACGHSQCLHNTLLIHVRSSSLNKPTHSLRHFFSGGMRRIKDEEAQTNIESQWLRVIVDCYLSNE